MCVCVCVCARIIYTMYTSQRPGPPLPPLPYLSHLTRFARRPPRAADAVHPAPPREPQGESWTPRGCRPRHDTGPYRHCTPYIHASTPTASSKHPRARPPDASAQVVVGRARRGPARLRRAWARDLSPADGHAHAVHPAGHLQESIQCRVRGATRSPS